MAIRLPDGFHGLALAMQDASPELAVDDENEADAMEIYAAVKPSGDEPELTGELPELSARLHSYQRRSAAWMVRRELAPQAGPLWLHSHFNWLDRPYLHWMTVGCSLFADLPLLGLAPPQDPLLKLYLSLQLIALWPQIVASGSAESSTLLPVCSQALSCLPRSAQVCILCGGRCAAWTARPSTSHLSPAC